MKNKKEVFEKQIKPELGNIRSNKYFKALLELEKNTTKNGGRGVRISQLPKDLKKSRHILKKLADFKFVKVTPPKGDGLVLRDDINDRTELFNKSEMINEYHDKIYAHLKKDSLLRKIVANYLNLRNDSLSLEWAKELEEDPNYKEYNQVIRHISDKEVDLKKERYGFLEWRHTANYYNLSEKTRNLFGEVSE
ncbi:hypothetical protein ACFLTH_04410 [Bacteroidota bacterium]